jgi:phage protein D
VVRQVASRLGLKVNIRDGLDQPVATQMQMNETDFGFLRRLLDRLDPDMQIVADPDMVSETLQVGPRAREDRGKLDLIHGNNLLRLRAAADLAGVAAFVRVAGWDPKQGSAAHFTASDGTLSPGAGRTGTSLVAQAIDAAPIEPLGTECNTTQQEAEAMAHAVFRKRARRFVHAHGTARATPACVSAPGSR